MDQNKGFYEIDRSPRRTTNITGLVARLDVLKGEAGLVQGIIEEGYNVNLKPHDIGITSDAFGEIYLGPILLECNPSLSEDHKRIISGTAYTIEEITETEMSSRRKKRINSLPKSKVVIMSV